MDKKLCLQPPRRNSISRVLKRHSSTPRIGAETPISLEKYIMANFETSFDQFFTSIEKDKVHFFLSTNWFLSINKQSARIVVWSMEHTHRLLFQRLVNYIKMTQRSRALILPLLFFEGSVPPPTLRAFLHIVFNNIEFIFCPEDSQASFNFDGSLRSCTIEFHWRSYLESPFLTSNVFILEYFVYINKDNFKDKLNHLAETLDKYKRQNHNIYFPRKRMQDLLLSWTVIFKEQVPTQLDELLKTKVFTLGIVQEQFVQVLQMRRDTIVKSLNMTNLLNTVNEVKTETTLDDLFRLNLITSEDFAKQVILFDHDALKNVSFNEFYTTKNFNTLQKYINNVKVVEKLAIHFLSKMPSKKLIQFFIESASYCHKLGGFNTSYLIYASLSHLMMKRIQMSELSSTARLMWTHLETLFSIKQNFKNYFATFELCGYPKIPITAMWMGEVIRFDDLPTFLEKDKLNMTKVRLISNVMSNLFASREAKFNFERNVDVQWLLCKFGKENATSNIEE
ncbi:hypothetical protein EIN_281340 [Entamoeba invadens IP1]|uniref:Ras-GEF domain-containing protein n=1 Tax=Entamoeba invadens IP1 TaxID=370355 RepID=A0A0A1TWZ2_ENTIV|nr:hypothetical protein EIN_281340 [Entamoeba invadens IP1]ELP85773.1 hypothetical protein EIN_281340 [Entamoeba invadens IP1]|eukprot:XP_004185119.1 hypothetical protein EIN_281340 [Entamoeba invadens IP1]